MTERTRILIEAVAFEILGVLNYVLHTALYLPLLLIWASLTPHFAATFVMFRIILRPEFRQQIFSGHLGEATTARLLGFIG